MVLLLLGILIFFGIHSISMVALELRNKFAAANLLAWKGIYAVISLVGLSLIIYGYGEARLTTSLVYATPMWLRHLSTLLMLPIFILFLAPYFPGKISQVTKHPQLIAVKLWAISHLLVNGTLADITLFGAFLLWAVANRISLKRRTANAVPALPKSGFNDVIIVILGLAFYVVFALHLHQMVTGIAPFAR